MAEYKEPQSGQASKGIGGADPRRQNTDSTSRSERESSPGDSNRGVARGSTGTGAMSNESDRADRDNSKASSKRTKPSVWPDEMPLTLGSNGGGRDDDQSPDDDPGGEPRGTKPTAKPPEAKRQTRKRENWLTMSWML